jgi:hypothetical protein
MSVDLAVPGVIMNVYWKKQRMFKLLHRGRDMQVITYLTALHSVKYWEYTRRGGVRYGTDAFHYMRVNQSLM